MRFLKLKNTLILDLKKDDAMKYVRSKSRIAKYIVPIIQSYINDTSAAFYLEPFIGGQM